MAVSEEERRRAGRARVVDKRATKEKSQSGGVKHKPGVCLAIGVAYDNVGVCCACRRTLDIVSVVPLDGCHSSLGDCPPSEWQDECSLLFLSA